MICFGGSEIDWGAVGAFGTMSASIIALFASWLAIKAPQWNKNQDRRESTGEVLAAADEALRLYAEAHTMTVGTDKWSTKSVSVLRIKAAHLYETLDRLVGRPSLTDGAIAVGAGAMSILHLLRSLETTEEIRQKKMARLANSKESRVFAMMVDSATPARETIEAAQALVDVVQERICRVKKYAKIV